MESYLCLVVLLGAVLRGTLQVNDQCNHTTEPPTELLFLPSNGSLDILCECDASSTQCVWISLADHGMILSNGTNESLFVWRGITAGYGQYRCLDNSRSSNNVAKNILILPDGETMNA